MKGCVRRLGRILMPGTDVLKLRWEGSAMADFSQLTDKQKQIYDCIREKIESRPQEPSYVQTIH